MLRHLCYRITGRRFIASSVAYIRQLQSTSSIKQDVIRIPLVFVSFFQIITLRSYFSSEPRQSRIRLCV